MADPGEFGLDVVGRHHIAVVEVTEVEFHRRLQAPLQRNLIDGDGPFAAVHRGGEVVGRVQMRAVVRCDPNPFDGPAFTVGQILHRRSREERHHLRGSLPMVVVVDLGQVPGWVRGDSRLQHNG